MISPEGRKANSSKRVKSALKPIDEVLKAEKPLLNFLTSPDRSVFSRPYSEQRDG